MTGLLEQLIERAGEVALLVVATARPELLTRRPGWGGATPGSAVVALPALSDQEGERANLPDTVTVYRNLANAVIVAGDLTRGFELQAKVLEAAERFGLTSDLRTSRWPPSWRTSKRCRRRSPSGRGPCSPAARSTRPPPSRRPGWRRRPPSPRATTAGGRAVRRHRVAP